MQRTRITARVLHVFLLAFAIVGCERRETVNKGPEGIYNLISVAKAYAQTATRERPPESVQDILPALKAIGDPQELLCSPRDGKPYMIVWGMDVRGPVSGRNGAPIIAYEREGKNGKRQVVDVMLKVGEYTAEEFARLNLPSPGKSGP